VPTNRWTGVGPEFSLSWGDRAWKLSFDEPGPGLRPDAGLDQVKLLSLEKLARTGRVDPAAFTPDTLVLFEQHHGSVRATFAPPGWGGLTVRAGWHPTAAGEGIDLEIQLSATTVGELDSVEVSVVSRHGDATGGRLVQPVGVLDEDDILLAPEAAGQPARPGLHTPAATAAHLPPEPRRPLTGPRVLTPAGTPPGWFYVEMARPGDVASRNAGDSRDESRTELPTSTRYALFGHDLEKGVILRARVRGYWINSNALEQKALACYHDFLREPPLLSP